MMKYFVYSGASSIMDVNHPEEPIASFIYPEHAEKFGTLMWRSTYYVTERETEDGETR